MKGSRCLCWDSFLPTKPVRLGRATVLKARSAAIPNGQWLLVNAVIRSTPESEPEPESIHAASAQKAQGQTVHFFRPEHGPKVEVKIEQPLVAETRYPAPKSAPKESAAAQSGYERYDYHMGRAKGYGFIRFGDESQNIFFHISAYH